MSDADIGPSGRRRVSSLIHPPGQPSNEVYSEVLESLRAELEAAPAPSELRPRSPLVERWAPTPAYWGVWSHLPDKYFSERSLFFMSQTAFQREEGHWSIRGEIMDELGLASYHAKSHDDGRLMFAKTYDPRLSIKDIEQRKILYRGTQIGQSDTFEGQWTIFNAPETEGHTGNFRIERLADSDVMNFVREKMAYDLHQKLKRR